MSRTILIFFSGLLIIVTEILPQRNTNFKHLTIEDGLSQSSVTCILQDKKGFLWFGTQDGLNRYDGYNFRVFKNIPSDSSSLSDNFIFSIYENKRGILYIETQSGNFHKYNPASESFRLVQKNQVDLIGSKVSTVGASLLEPSGVKWIGGAGKGTGLERLDLKTGHVIRYKHIPSDTSSLSDDKVYSIFRDRSGNLWVGTSDGLNKLDEAGGRFLHYKNQPGNPGSLPDNWVWPIFEDSHGFLWIGTVRGGLSCFDPHTNIFTNYKNNPNNPLSISDNFIFSIYEDKGGIIWVGTNTGGINYFHHASQVFSNYLHDPKNKNSLSDNNVLAINVDSKGNYWAGTRNGGLDKINPYKNTFYNYSANSSYKLLSNLIQIIYEDKSGMLWLGTFSSGLMEFNPSNGTYKTYKNNPADPNSISDNRIYAVTEDSQGFIWIGTYGGGLNRLNRKTGEVTVYKPDEKKINSISSNSVWSIIEDKSGSLWIGTFGSGADVLGKNRETFKHFENNPNDPGSICDNNIIRIFEDSRGIIWFGTTKGLSRYIKETDKFKNYNEKNGLANNFIFGILEDNNGNIWLSTNKGLSKFDPKREIFKNYYDYDGLPGNEFNQNAFAKDSRTGKLLFGGPNGFTVFNPSGLKNNDFVPPVVFTDYLRYNTDDQEGKPIFEKGISERNGIFLHYKDNIITLRFAALSYYNNFNNLYKYRLEGFNDNWIRLENNHWVTFTNLSPGDYKLRVIASNNDGIWNEKGAALNIEVLPPWWRSKIAYIFYGISVFSLLYGLRKFELNRREEKAKMRETELRMKATEAEKRAIEAENDRKTKELEEARKLQLSMLPRELPHVENLEIAAFMRTATEVGGDYYDFNLQKDGILNIAFGDATGHGLQAGTMVTLMKGFFTSDSARLELKEFMDHCNEKIREIRLGRMLMSFSYLKIKECSLIITSAGMPPVYYYNKEINEVEEIIIQGMPLGAMSHFSYKIIERNLRSGDIILLLTDGLPEQMNVKEEIYDYIRVKNNFRTAVGKNPAEIINHLISSADEWMQGTAQADDISIVVVKIK